MLSLLRLEWIRTAVLSASLGWRARDRVTLWWFNVRLALASVVDRTTLPPITVRLAPDGHPVVLSGAGELAVLRGVLLEREYEAQGEPATILDLGANVGLTTLFFRRRYPAARIVAVEADPRTYERLRRNVSGLSDVSTLNRAVAGTDGRMAFYSARQSISSSLARRSPLDIAVEIDCVTVQGLMERFGIDRVGLLKMDIEGAEFEALAAAPLDRVDELIAEIHYDLGDGDEQSLRSTLAGFDLTFEAHGPVERRLLRARRSGF